MAEGRKKGELKKLPTAFCLLPTVFLMLLLLFQRRPSFR